jgi:hypothetical protein
MATSLKITLQDGTVSEYEITPSIQYAFEQYAKTGFHKAFRENERQSDVFWIAWEALRRNGHTVKPFGDQFIDTLKDVEVVVVDSPNG